MHAAGHTGNLQNSPCSKGVLYLDTLTAESAALTFISSREGCDFKAFCMGLIMTVTICRRRQQITLL